MAGATWEASGERTAANGVWGAAPDDVWVIRARTLHHSTDGAGEHWVTRTLPVPFSTQLEGMWGVGRDRYVFGTDRSSQTGVVLHSRDGGTSWQRETADIERVAAIWGSAADNVYAVGARGAILHSKGDGRWQVVRTPTTGSLEGIWGTSASAIYAVGTGGTILFSRDGKTWTPRTSGASYTLSSIVGLSGRELMVGSVDGSPLRSSDGVTWKQLTAMVPRGQVWASDGRVVVASTEVHYFGEAQPSAAIKNPVPVELRDLFSRFAQYPAAMELLQHAAHNLDPSYRAPLGQPGVARIRISKVSNCSATLDALQDPRLPGSGTEMWVALRCDKPCTPGVTPKVTRELAIVIDGTPRPTSKTVDDPDLCWDQRPRNAVLKGADLALQGQLRAIRDMAIVNATSENAKLDAYARYVIDGGWDLSQQEIARILKKPMSWKGFFWHAKFTPPAPSKAPNCQSQVVADHTTRAAAAYKTRDFKIALDHYRQVWPCDPSARSVAYLAACRARAFGEAQQLYDQLGNPNLRALCLAEGFDPGRP